MEVVATERLSDHFQRITLGGEGFLGFEDVAATDKYVKLLLPADPTAGLQPPFDLTELRKALPKHQLPVRRTYTVHSVNNETRTLAIDFVLHGAVGVAGPWAEAADVGDRLQFAGPGGSYTPDSDADWHLLAGDEAALPAIAASLEAMPQNAVGAAYIEVASADDEWSIRTPAGVEVTWLHRGGAFTPHTGRLEEAIRQAPWRSGKVQAFVHGERGTMKSLRRFLMDDRGVERAQLSLSAYWAYGRAEDIFQAEKAEPVGQI